MKEVFVFTQALSAALKHRLSYSHRFPWSLSNCNSYIILIAVDYDYNRTTDKINTPLHSCDSLAVGKIQLHTVAITNEEV